MAKKIVFRAGVIPYYLPDGKILMMFMRPSNPRFGGDVWQIAKGKYEAGENAEEAGLREAGEELGLFRGNILAKYNLGRFLGRTTFILAKIKDPNMFGEPHFETGAVKWMTPEEFQKEGRDLHIPIVKAAVRFIENREKQLEEMRYDTSFVGRCDYLREIYKDEYTLVEGLIRTYSISVTIPIIQRQFPFFKIGVDKSRQKFWIEWAIEDHNKIDLIKLVQLINTYGWFFAIMYIDMVFEKPIDKSFDLKEFTQIFKNQSYTKIKLIISAKYAVEVDSQRIPKILYHVTPTVNVDKILKIGLVPKSRSKLAFHPERVHLAKDLIGTQIIQHKQTEITGITKWSTLRINTNYIQGPFILFYDPDMEGGYYTLNNIPPYAIEVNE